MNLDQIVAMVKVEEGEEEEENGPKGASVQEDAAAEQMEKQASLSDLVNTKLKSNDFSK